MKKILFIEFWNCTPHIETSLELAKIHIDAGDDVAFYFCGHDTLYKEGIVASPGDCGLFRLLPEVLGIRLIKSRRLSFYSRVVLPNVEIDKSLLFKNNHELINYKYKSFDIGLGVLSSLVSNTGNSNPDLVKLSSTVLSMLESSAQVYEFSKSLINKEKPDLIYLFNGRFCNHRAVRIAAQEKNVDILYHERGGSKNLYYLEPYMTHDAQKFQKNLLKKWEQVKTDPDARAEGIAFFEKRRLRNEDAWLSFTKYQKLDLLPVISNNKKIVTYFSSSDDEFVAVGDIFKFTNWENQFDALNDLIEICQNHKDIQLFIRVHPHINQKSYEDQQRWLSLKSRQGVSLISYDSEVDTYALIDRSDIIVTAGSTVGIEATFWGKASILLGPSHYSELQGTYNPKGKIELNELITSNLKPLEKEVAISFGYYLSTFGIRYKYYQAETLFKGKFMGVDLQEISETRLKFQKYKNLIIRVIQIIKKYFNNK